jgi:hypothetical protein
VTTEDGYIRVEPTTFTVCGLPADDVNAAVWKLTVESRGRGLWAVMHMDTYCLSETGEWDYEPSPSNRGDEFLATHRFDREEALRLAQEVYPNLIVNSMWVRDGKLVHAE